MPDIIKDTTEPLAPPADAGPSRKHGKKTSRSRSRKTIHEESEDDDEQADEEHQKLEKKPRASTRSLSRSVLRKKGPSSRKKKTVPPVSEEAKEESDNATPAGSTITRSRSRKSTKPTVAQQSDTDEHETSTLTKSKKSSSRIGSRSKVASLEGYATAPEKIPEEDGDDRHEEEEKPSYRMDTKSKHWEDVPVIKVNKVEEQRVLELSKARKTSMSSERSTTIVKEESKTTTGMGGGGDGNEQETIMFTNSEDEIEADLEDVQLDDTETDDCVAEEPPQEQGVIDEISFAPRLVTKAFSEVEQEQQQQRPRTPNLVPFMEMVGTQSSSPGRLYLGTNAAGPEEKVSEVETPKTPPRKIVVNKGDPVPTAWSTDDLTTNPGVDVAKVENTALQSESEQVEEKGHRHRTLQQGQEPLKTQQQPVEPQFVPFLSKLPFLPLHMLTEAELDMTVEDWIRYQMEVEYDKFKRDGERELMRFKKKAEETRRIIEQL